MKRKRKRIRRVLLLYLPLCLIAASILTVLLYKVAPVPVTPLMVKRCVQGESVGVSGTEYKWVSLTEISPNMVRVVIASEDNSFFSHSGFDFDEISKMANEYLNENGRFRGCSTIPQQTAKNCFTWCTDTWLRKGVEAYFTVLIEKIWGKRRIMEVYLNVAEMGKGIYGVQAASLHYFGHPASELSVSEAASLACCLPNPLRRTPDIVNRKMGSIRNTVMRRSQGITVPSEWRK